MISSIVWYSLAAFVSGTPTGWAWGKYMHYAKVYDEDRAAFWDIVICLLSSVLSLTLWSASGQNALVLVAFAFGNGLGTKYVVRYNAKKAWKDALYEHIRSQSEET